MANAKLNPGIRQDMVSAANAACKNRLAFIDREFPLTVDEVQYGIMAREDVETLRDLFQRVPTLERVRSSTISFVATANPRHPVIQYNAKPSIFTSESSLRRLKFNIDSLPVDRQQVLTQWLDNALREHRLAKMTGDTIDNFLNRINTSYELVVNWPALARLAANDKTWRRRLSERPRRPQDYTISPSPMEAKLRQAATVYLTSSLMLPQPEKEPAAYIASWTKLDGDKF